MVITHNLAAINGNRMYNINSNRKAAASEKLSSGYRINRAADDAAGLSISEKMRKQIRGLSQASRNAEEGISLIQVADGAMNEVHAMAQRGNELCVQAANGTLSDSDRAAIQQELDALEEEINAMANRTKFNEIFVLKGQGKEQVSVSPGNAIIKGGFPDWADVKGVTDGYMSGTYTNEKIFKASDNTETTYNIEHVASTIDFSAYTGTAAQKSELIGQGFYATCCTCTAHYSIRFTEGTQSSSEYSGQHYIINVGIDNCNKGKDLIDAIIGATGERAGEGEPLNHYTVFAHDNLNENKLVVYDVRSKGPNPATGTSGEWLDWEMLDGQRDGDVQFNIDAGMWPGSGLFGVGVAIAGEDFEEVREAVGLKLQVGAESGDFLDIELPEISSLALGIDTVDASTQEGALEGISLFDKAIQYVSKERGRMGAYQNRLEHAIKNLDNTVENTTAAESQIRDADMAKEMVELSSINVIQQAAQAMLAQANQMGQGVLSLLQ